MSKQREQSPGLTGVPSSPFPLLPPVKEKPFGWEVDVEVQMTIVQTEIKTFHYRGCSERQARYKAMLRGGGKAVAARPVTEQQWISAYGIGRM